MFLKDFGPGGFVKLPLSYIFNGMPTLYGGTFTMTTVAFGNAFASLGNASNGYESKTFREFLNHRSIIASRLEEKYAATRYPNAGFLANSSLADQPYNPEKGNVSRNSSDVLIPAFLAAYTGKDPKKIELTAFPKALANLLPNWRISYDGSDENALSTFKQKVQKIIKADHVGHAYIIEAHDSESAFNAGVYFANELLKSGGGVESDNMIRVSGDGKNSNIKVEKIDN